jgi:hypothetical protein
VREFSEEELTRRHCVALQGLGQLLHCTGQCAGRQRGALQDSWWQTLLPPGQRRMFGNGVDTTVPSGKWSTLRVEFAGQLFTVFFNGSKLFEVEDNTFTEAGNVGVWTKADSVTLFDDFSYGEK